MTEDTNTETTSNKPQFIANAVRKNEGGGKDYFTPIGVAFLHKKGGGFTIDLVANPVDGRIVLFPSTKPKA